MEKSQAAQGHTAVRLPPWAMVGPTVSSWWALSLPVHLLLQSCILCSFGALIWDAGFAYVRSFWASFASFFDPHGLSRFILSAITWLITCKSVIKTRKSRNKRNWRNKGVNHKIKHINPQEWILNTQLILAYMTMIVHTYDNLIILV